MTQYQFDASQWIRRLAEAIESVLDYERDWDDALRSRHLEESSVMGLSSGIHEDARLARISEYWHLRPTRGAREHTEYEKSILALCASIEEIVLEHPIIKGRLIRSDHFTGIRVYSPSSQFPMSTDQIIEGILSYAVDCGALYAASSLEERIRLGEERNLDGSQVTLFHGLRVEGSHDLSKGITVTSLEAVEDKVDLAHIEHLLLMKRLVRTSVSLIGVVSWDYKWGPSIEYLDDDELKFSEIPSDLNEVADLALAALGLVCDAPITRIGSFGDNFDRRIARALCYRDRYTTLKDVRAKLQLGTSNKPAKVLDDRLFVQVSDVFCRLKQFMNHVGPHESTSSLTAEDIKAMCSRYNDFKLGDTHLTAMAYFVLTMLEKEFSSDGHKRAAEKYGLSRRALGRTANLASRAGGLEQARKASGVDKELTEAESQFLEQSARQIILRAIEVVAEPDAEMTKVTLSELQPE